nr:2OG-Fe dioxygenase family protein [Mycobacterium sp. 1423905.2]
MHPLDSMRSLAVDDAAWTEFSRHWEELAPDPYAAELGIQRLRRYGHYSFRNGTFTPVANLSFVQPQDSNPLYIGRDRRFEPLTEAFANEPLLHRWLELLGGLAETLDEVEEWTVKVHPFRVLSSADGQGLPTPEGLHRDGVTLVSSLLINRCNATGGESLVCDLNGRRLLTATLAEPGTCMLGDDRRTMHGVSPVRPIDPAAPAVRDVLVVTFASG